MEQLPIINKTSPKKSDTPQQGKYKLTIHVDDTLNDTLGDLQSLLISDESDKPLTPSLGSGFSFSYADIELRAITRFMQGQYASAIPYFHTMLKNRTDLANEPWFMHYLMHSYNETGQAEKTLAIFQSIIDNPKSKMREDWNIALDIAKAQLRSKVCINDDNSKFSNYYKALCCVNRAVKLNESLKSDPRYLVCKIHALIGNNLPDEALSYIGELGRQCEGALLSSTVLIEVHKHLEEIEALAEEISGQPAFIALCKMLDGHIQANDSINKQLIFRSPKTAKPIHQTAVQALSMSDVFSPTSFQKLSNAPTFTFVNVLPASDMEKKHKFEQVAQHFELASPRAMSSPGSSRQKPLLMDFKRQKAAYSPAKPVVSSVSTCSDVQTINDIDQEAMMVMGNNNPRSEQVDISLVSSSAGSKGSRKRKHGSSKNS